jgi:hypothetical protein
MSNPDEALPDPLARAQAAYASGDFARVRVEAELARKSTDAEAAQKARELEARVGIDSWTWAVLGAAVALFCGIVVAYAHG